jgi:molecular chaperone DnaK (HSP70)
MKPKRPASKIRIGIDFGTTRTLVASVEKGNYPLATFETEGEEVHDWYPSLVAARGSEMTFGWKAWAKQADEDWHKFRSFKRLLSRANVNSTIELGGREIPLLELLIGYFRALRHDLLENSNLNVHRAATFEAMIGIPANANSNQRFLTLEAFRRAGFGVLGMVNEPSAAGIEYTYRYRRKTDERRLERLLVYDLGGGTFDLSVIQIAELNHRVVTTMGIEYLGGDDFDSILARLALSRGGLDPILQSDFWLLEECRQKKEDVNPNTKKIHIDLSRFMGKDFEVAVPASEFYEHCLPLVEKTLSAVDAILAQPSSGEASMEWSQEAGLYLVGGAAELPIISRLSRERYGRRLRRSPYPRAATAIGLAIAADEMAGYTLEDQFTRHFGVWREADEGENICFDPIFTKGTSLPSRGHPLLVRSRRYRPVHNIGHFRYIECSQIDGQGLPTGDITAWDEIHFPFDPELIRMDDVEKIPIRRLDPHEASIEAEEIYTCDRQGVVKATLINHATGLRKSYRLRRGA